MIVIASKTEIKLREDLGTYLIQKPAQRCFYLALSQTLIPKGELFETFLRLLEEIPNAYMARVYFCQDKDVFIMMEGFMQRQFQAFVKKLSATLKTEDFSELIDVFEIGMHWNKLESLCAEKIKAIEAEQAREHEEIRKGMADKITLDVLSKLDPKRVSDIAARRSARNKPLVMIADDDKLTRALAGNVLRAEYDSIYALNGTEALQEYVTHAPDILFLDIGMPDIGGHEVLESLFQLDPDACIIMFSGRKDKATIMKSLEMGAQGFMGKPFTRNELFEHVRNSPYIQSKKSDAA